MKLTIHKSKIKTLRQGDPLFTIKDGLMTSPRAGFEIKKECPNTYAQVIAESINRGWLQPVAYMTAEEQLMETLKL